jgi:hypothetical protein
MSFPRNMMEGAVVEETESAPQINFLMRKCAHCDVELALGAGDVLFGEKWYHSRCWQMIQALGPEESGEG